MSDKNLNLWMHDNGLCERMSCRPAVTMNISQQRVWSVYSQASAPWSFNFKSRLCQSVLNGMGCNGHYPSLDVPVDFVVLVVLVGQYLMS